MNISRLTPHASRFTLHASRLTLLAILLLASFLRFYRLDAQSFWNDEGNSARIAERTVRLIVEGAAGDIHPPGYYLLLHYWRALCGHSEFALRAFSVFAGVLAVVFTYLLGRRLLGKTTGLLAACLAAISPFAVYYSQEARMYALLGTLSAASTYLLMRLLTAWQASLPVGKPASLQTSIPNPQSLIAYTLLTAVGLYTQYAFFFILLVHNAVFGIWWLLKNRRWRGLAAWVSAQVAIVVLYLPWLPVALRATGWPSAEMTVRLEQALLDVLRVLTVGITLPLAQATLALTVAGVLLFIGLWPRRGGWFPVLVTALYLLLPITLILAFGLYKPAWLKFLIVVLPPFHVLAARGMDNLAEMAKCKRQEARGLLRRASCILHPTSCILHPTSCILHPTSCILFVLLSVIAVYPSIRNLYFDSAYARDDYRQIAADIATQVQPGDAIILNAPNQWEVFTYYYPDQDVYPAPYHPTPDQVEAFLAPLTARYRRLFALYWGDAESDPQRLIGAWLAFHAYKATDRWYGRVRLAIYGIAALPQEPTVALNARFGGIRLYGYALTGAHFAPSDVLPVTSFWEAETPTPERYKVTVQLLDAAGQLVAQHDGEPADGLAPTDTWQPGRRVLDRHGVFLPDDLQPGRYTLALALYHIAGGERLPATFNGRPVGNLLTLASIEMEP